MGPWPRTPNYNLHYTLSTLVYNNPLPSQTLSLQSLVRAMSWKLNAPQAPLFHHPPISALLNWHVQQVVVKSRKMHQTAKERLARHGRPSRAQTAKRSSRTSRAIGNTYVTATVAHHGQVSRATHVGDPSSFQRTSNATKGSEGRYHPALRSGPRVSSLSSSRAHAVGIHIHERTLFSAIWIGKPPAREASGISARPARTAAVAVSRINFVEHQTSPGPAIYSLAYTPNNPQSSNNCDCESKRFRTSENSYVHIRWLAIITQDTPAAQTDMTMLA